MEFINMDPSPLDLKDHQGLQRILQPLTERGHEQYGPEAVSQLEHALQCAALAEQAGSEPALIAAALLHDLGHLLHDLGEDAAERGIDDRHEYRAMGLLQQLFGSAVAEPVRLHVEAKRYLCAVQTDYWASLSPASQTSLELQGGVFSAEEAQDFIQQPHAQNAARLRAWDDLAKNPDQSTPSLAHFIPVLQACLK